MQCFFRLSDCLSWLSRAANSQSPERWALISAALFSCSVTCIRWVAEGVLWVYDSPDNYVCQSSGHRRRRGDIGRVRLTPEVGAGDVVEVSPALDREGD